MGKEAKETGKDTIKAALESCFDSNPSLDSLFQTADGQCFAKETDAKAHSQTLDNKAVKEYHRES